MKPQLLWYVTDHHELDRGEFFALFRDTLNTPGAKVMPITYNGDFGTCAYTGDATEQDLMGLIDEE